MLLPTRIGPLVTPLLAHTGQPDRSSRRPHTHTRLLFLKPCAMLTIMGPPWTLHPRTSTVLAHDPMLGPRFRISHPSCAAAPHSNAGTIHPGSSQHLSAQRPRSTLLCTAHLSGLLMHLRISPLHLSGCALQLPVLGVAPNCGSTHSPKVTRFVMECLPERPLPCSAAQAGCGCSTAGWRSRVQAREDVRRG